MNRPPDFIQIPHQVFTDRSLSAIDMLVYGLVYWYTKLKNEKCYASNDTFAELLGVQPRKVSESLGRLADRGCVEILYKDEAKRHRLEIIPLIAYVRTDRLDSPKGPTVDSPTGPQKKNIQRIKEKKTLYGDPDFISFWEIYPKKEGKGDAWKAWLKIHVEDKKVILDSVKDHLENHDNWKPDPKTGDPRDGGRFIPNPATFLNQRRFEDEVKKSRPSKVAGKYAGV